MSGDESDFLASSRQLRRASLLLVAWPCAGENLEHRKSETQATTGDRTEATIAVSTAALNGAKRGIISWPGRAGYNSNSS